METKIGKIKNYVDNLAIVVSDVLDTDVIIIDADMNMVGSAFKYFSLYNDIKYGTLMAEVLVNNKVLCIDDKAKSEGCRNCKDFRVCKMKGFIGMPIRFENRVIGVIALILQPSKVKALFSRLDSTISFMENMAKLIAVRIREHEQKKTLKKKVRQIGSMLDVMKDAVVYCDIYGHIIDSNKTFRDIFEKDGNTIANLKELYPDAVFRLKKKKKQEGIKVSIEKRGKEFYGILSVEPVTLEEDGYICTFKKYSDIKNSSALFSQGSLATFSWLSKYINKEKIEKAKLLAESDKNLLIHSEENALNELLAKAIFNYSDRRLNDFRVIYMQNVYRDLVETFLLDEYGLIQNLGRGTLVIVKPENMTLYVQDKMAECMKNKRLILKDNRRIDTDVRFIMCTTANLKDLVQKGMFSKSLYETVEKNCITELETIHNDYTLFEKFVYSGVRYYSRIYGKREETFARLLIDRLWPMIDAYDLSTLELFIEHAVKSQKIEIFHTMKDRPIREKEQSMETIEKYRMKTLLSSGKSKEQISEILGISRSTLYRKIKKYGM